MTSGIADLVLASTSTPGMPATLVGTQAGAVFGQAFTNDSGYALYYGGTLQVGAGLVGSFTSTSVTNPSKPTVYAKNVWVSYNGEGSLSVYNDGYKTDKYTGRGDIRVADCASGTTGQLVVQQAEADFYITWDYKTMVYAMQVGANPGIYSKPATLK